MAQGKYDDNFQFYEHIEGWKKEREAKEERERLMAGIDIVDVPEQESKVTRTRSNGRISKAKAIACTAAVMLLLTGFAAGLAAPTIKDFTEREHTRLVMADLEEHYLVTQEGYMLDLDVKKDFPEGFLADGPATIDYDDPENVRVTESGRKVGPLVDYYDGLDAYTEREAGIGYYEFKLAEFERLEAQGKETPDFIYTTDELREIVSPKPTMGGK